MHYYIQYILYLLQCSYIIQNNTEFIDLTTDIIPAHEIISCTPSNEPECTRPLAWVAFLSSLFQAPHFCAAIKSSFLRNPSHSKYSFVEKFLAYNGLGTIVLIVQIFDPSSETTFSSGSIVRPCCAPSHIHITEGGGAAAADLSMPDHKLSILPLLRRPGLNG